MFVFFSIVYYEIVIGIASAEKGNLRELSGIKKEIGKLSDQAAIQEMVKKSDDLYESIADDAVSIYNAFIIIELLSFFNMTFLL